MTNNENDTEANAASLDRLYAAWRRVGVNFTVEACEQTVELEPLILETAKLAALDERLTICAVSWLACYHDFVDGRRLSELTRDTAPFVTAYLGVMLSLAIEAPEGARRAPQFEAALAHCRPLRQPRAMYDTIESMPRLREWMKAHTFPFYQHWGFWHNDMTLKRSSIYPLGRILTVPELRARALCGPSLEATFVARTIGRTTNARRLSREVGVTYAAAHAAVERLVGRGILVKERKGVRQELRLSEFAAGTLGLAPT